MEIVGPITILLSYLMPFAIVLYIVSTIIRALTRIATARALEQIAGDLARKA